MATPTRRRGTRSSGRAGTNRASRAAKMAHVAATAEQSERAADATAAPAAASDNDLDELLRKDAEIDAADAAAAAQSAAAILQRWEFGQMLLARRVGKQLPAGLLDKLVEETGKSRSELQYRVQFAERCRTEDEVSNAVGQNGSWHAIVSDFLPAKKKRKATGVRVTATDDARTIVTISNGRGRKLRKSDLPQDSTIRVSRAAPLLAAIANQPAATLADMITQAGELNGDERALLRAAIGQREHADREAFRAARAAVANTATPTIKGA